jgi:hypothetical protein
MIITDCAENETAIACAATLRDYNLLTVIKK